MKKIFIFSLGMILLTQCSKKETAQVATAQETSDIKNDSLQTEKPKTLQEWDETKVKALIQPKKNDTIYVTNFFATWCGPCIREIPHFKEKMEELKNEKVKFTFVSVDRKEDWATKVNDFGAEQNLNDHIVLFDAEKINTDFFTKNFKTWTGESIPFTLITKGEKRDETVGMMSKNDLDAKIKSFK